MIVNRIFLLLLCLTLTRTVWSSSIQDYIRSAFDQIQDLGLDSAKDLLTNGYKSLNYILSDIPVKSLIEKTIQNAPDISSIIDLIDGRFKQTHETELENRYQLINENSGYVKDSLTQLSENLGIRDMMDSLSQTAPSWDNFQNIFNSLLGKNKDLLDPVGNAKNLITSLMKNVPAKDTEKIIGLFEKNSGRLKQGINQIKAAVNFDSEDLEAIIKRNLNFIKNSWASFKEETGVDEETLLFLAGIAIEYAPISMKAKVVLGSCLTLITYGDIILDSYEQSQQDTGFSLSLFANKFANRVISKLLFSSTKDR